MSDFETGGVPAVPAAPSTSLSPAAAAEKTQIELMMADGSYWRGLPGMPAATIQQRYQDLIRGELSAARTAVGPAHEPDLDMPLHIGGYDFSGAPGARSMTGADRDVLDTFLPVAFAAGIGQRKVAEALGFALSAVNPTQEDFRQFAVARGWSDYAIAVCLDWFRTERSRRSST